MKQASTHYIEDVNPAYNNGWAKCGRLIAYTQNLDETNPAHDIITCKQCIKVLKKEDSKPVSL